jgi:hypothetical protein
MEEVIEAIAATGCKVVGESGASAIAREGGVEHKAQAPKVQH